MRFSYVFYLNLQTTFLPDEAGSEVERMTRQPQSWHSYVSDYWQQLGCSVRIGDSQVVSEDNCLRTCE